MRTRLLPAPRFAAKLLAVVLGLFGIAATLRAQTVITSLPYTISTKGLYVLESDLSSTQTDGFLITVKANNVTIDFQGHYIAGQPGAQPTATSFHTVTGVNAYEQSNVTIRNGTIAYCYTGININGNNSSTTNSVNHRIENMRVTYSYGIGIRIDASPGSRITDCQVSQTGYSGATNTPTGIVAIGAGTTVSNNVVSNVTGTNSMGILSYAGSFVRQNTITNCIYGVRDGKYQDNLTSGCTYPFSEGIDAGGNN